MKKRGLLLLCSLMAGACIATGCGSQGAGSGDASLDASGNAAVASADASADASGDAQNVVAGMNTINDMGVEGSTFYVYAPENPHTFDLMSGLLNGAIYLYPDTPYESEDEAYEAIKALGLDTIAEESPAYIIVPQPLNGSSWEEADLELYEASQKYLSGGTISMTQTGPTSEYNRCIYNNLQYIMAEGSGSTFVNNVLSQNAGRIAGILTFGGEMDESISEGYALPAYLVNAQDNAVEYYKKVNETDTDDGDRSYNSGYTEKQVISVEGSDSFDADTIRTAWDKTLSHLTRACLDGNVVLDNTIQGDWLLETWPNYSELGITVTDHEMDGYEVHDFVPETAEDGAPLIIVLHGLSDDPYYTVNSTGWADMAAQEGLVVIAPDYPGFGMGDATGNTDAPDFVKSVIEYASETYGIDESRVYLTGFSMGGATTGFVAEQYPELFAGVVCMGATGLVNDAAADTSTFDLPFAVMVGTIDDNNITEDEDGNPMMLGIRGDTTGLESMFAMNEIKIDSFDYAAYPYWGFETEKTETVTYKTLNYNVQTMSMDGYEGNFMEFVTLEGAAHSCSDYYATLAWEFMSQYSRNADGEITYNK
ncbi:MAG: alpha/beta fold hydrolase [Eubacterium sp.]|nr:alpha/beta fold hydrolase [Eubacterium sp.]